MEQKKESQSTKKNLLASNDDDSDAEDDFGADVAVWLILTTKKHIVDKNRLKPGKISVPHSLHSSPSLSICLITADPQRAVKDVIAEPSFPKTLSSRITKIIGFSKLKARYQSFESRRQLLSEHDLFLADDRIILRLVQTLGKIFYQSSKRPIPIRIDEIQKVNGKRVKKDDKKRPPTNEKYASVAGPEVVAKEIERTISCVPVHLAPAATAAIRVGNASFSPEQLSANVEAVVGGMAERFVSHGWRNIKAMHIKGPNTMAMPIWLASELWLGEEDVRENPSNDAIEGAPETGKKRKSTGQPESSKSKKSKKTTPAIEKQEEQGNGDAELIASRKAKLEAQKAKALSEGGEGPVASDNKSAADATGASKSSRKKKTTTKS